jgi:uncharacterized protein involved in type VI secretion and phage assembly
MHRVVDSIRQIARHEIAGRENAGLAVVKAVHGANGDKDYAATVQLRESGLVLPRVPIATGLTGYVALPRENDLVVVLFVGGDLHAPIIVGRLYSQEVAPPAHGPGEVVVVLPGDETSPDKRLELRVKTPGDGTRSLDLLIDGTVKVELAIDDQSIRLKAQDAELLLRQTGSSDGVAELKAAGSRVRIEQGGNVTLEAQGTLKLKATNIEIKADASVKISGSTIDLN